ncbi:organic cation transporter protein [Copidosoma floridanum]|uniref:organic cation transporter protein n=1 Tax=Copidosoma floridanum TaxID=29053 RepID=UPI0006C97B4F|nr:organic cation transporter protein [Copidosoma floridanum]XP_014203837.1 organic cation transporter protein [Copidosoma floridanum]
MGSVDGELEEIMSHLGEFGKYQAWQFSLHVIGGLTAGLHMLTLMTVAAVPSHSCDLSDLHDPNTTLGQPLDSCRYLDADNRTRACQAWIYDTSYYESSRAIEWNFVCSRRWMGAVAQSAYMFGVFVGAVTLGSMADKYGRKIIFYVSSVCQLIFGVLVAAVPEYYTFLVVRFLYGIFGSAGAYITGFVLTMELVGPSKRTVCGMMFQVAFAAGFMLVAAWGAIIKDRFWLQVTYGLHSALLLGHWWLMDESPRWLWAQGRVTEALDIVQRALRFNSSPVQLNLAKYSGTTEERVNGTRSGSISGPDGEQQQQNSYGATDLLKTPNLRLKTLNVCLNWFANSIVYYGLSLNTGNLVGNPYLMMFLSGLVEIPSYVLCILLMDRVGRRALISALMLVGGICCISAASIDKDEPGMAVYSVVVVLFGKACIAGSFAIVYNYTAELFPTVLRNTALGVGSMCARLSGALTPMIMLLDSFDPKVPATVFGFVALLAGFLVLYLPETLNQPMPETLEDGENFGRGDTCFTTCFKRKVRDKQAYEVALQKIDEPVYQKC